MSTITRPMKYQDLPDIVEAILNYWPPKNDKDDLFNEAFEYDENKLHWKIEHATPNSYDRITDLDLLIHFVYGESSSRVWISPSIEGKVRRKNNGLIEFSEITLAGINTNDPLVEKFLQNLKKMHTGLMKELAKNYKLKQSHALKLAQTPFV